MVMSVEVGAREFIALSVHDYVATKAPKLLDEIAKNSSHSIWSKRKKRLFHKDKIYSNYREPSWLSDILLGLQPSHD